MHRRFRRYLPPAAVAFVARRSLLFFVLLARVAVAAPNDAAAQKLRDEAIYTDYLATNFTEAEKKLSQAAGLCKSTAECSPGVRARLSCDRGVVAFTLHKPAEGRAFFVGALKEDPNVALDRDLSTTDIQREFAAVKSHPEGSAPAAGEGNAPSGATVPAPNAGAGEPALVHDPPPVQAVQTPLPLYVAVPPGLDSAKVVVRYKPVGASKWQSLPMAKMGEGYGVEIPCGDVGSREGTFQYFVQALDGNGDLVAASARLASPWSVAIAKQVTGDAPHFPGQLPPSACIVAPGATTAGATVESTSTDTDCPPGMAGCHSGEHEACTSNDDCLGTQSCVSGVCRGSDEGQERPAVPAKKNWLTLAFEQDFMLLPSVNNTCLGGSHYTCFSDSGTYYANTPVKDADDAVNGGFALSTSRILAGYDRVVGSQIALGGRLGVAFGGGPQRPTGAAFFPVHIEARASYWFGKNVFSRKGFRFFALAAGGAAEINSSAPVDVFEADPPNPSRPRNLNLRAWRKSGLGFGALGVGSMFALTSNTGIHLELKAIETFPTTATAFSIQLGFAQGL